MNRFHVSIGWRTEAGTLAHDAFVIAAMNEEQATRICCRRIVQDRRRSFAGNLQASCIRLPEGEA